MEELLIMGNVEKDFERLEIEFRQTYRGADYSVCEVTEKELKVLCDEPYDIFGAWKEGGWRYCKGSNQGIPSDKVLIRNKELMAWYDDSLDFDSDEEREEYLKENYGVIERFHDLLQYLCDEIGCSQPRNVCALAKDLARYNNIKMSELFEKYQG
ncbi:MAG: hypothetical protein RR891_06165 [Clostridium sp.]